MNSDPDSHVQTSPALRIADLDPRLVNRGHFRGCLDRRGAKCFLRSCQILGSAQCRYCKTLPYISSKLKKSTVSRLPITFVGNPSKRPVFEHVNEQQLELQLGLLIDELRRYNQKEGFIDLKEEFGSLQQDCGVGLKEVLVVNVPGQIGTRLGGKVGTKGNPKAKSDSKDRSGANPDSKDPPGTNPDSKDPPGRNPDSKDRYGSKPRLKDRPEITEPNFTNSHMASLEIQRRFQRLTKHKTSKF